MIRLTLPSGDYVYINPDRIDNITAAPDDGSTVFTAKEEISVIEDHEEVVRKIMDYRLEMVRYKAAIEKNEFMIAADHHARLDDLAGLEEETDA